MPWTNKVGACFLSGKAPPPQSLAIGALLPFWLGFAEGEGKPEACIAKRCADSFDVGRGRFAAFPEGAHKALGRRSLPPFSPSPRKRPVIRSPDGATVSWALWASSENSKKFRVF